MTSARRTEGWREADTFYDFYHHPPFSLFSFILPFPEPSDWFAPYNWSSLALRFGFFRGSSGAQGFAATFPIYLLTPFRMLQHIFRVWGGSSSFQHFTQQPLQWVFHTNQFRHESHSSVSFLFFLYLSQRLTHCFELFNILSVFAEMPTYCPENL